MPRVQRRGHRRAQVDVAQSHDQVTGIKDDVAHLVDAVQAVDAADELDVVGAPGRVGAHRCMYLLDGLLDGRVVPGQRQMHDARRHDGVGGRRRPPESPAAPAAARAAGRGVVVDLQRADARRDVDDARQAAWPAAPASARGRGSAVPGPAPAGPVLDQHVDVASWRSYDLRPRWHRFGDAPRSGPCLRGRARPGRRPRGSAGNAHRRSLLGAPRAARHPADGDEARPRHPAS